MNEINNKNMSLFASLSFKKNNRSGITFNYIID